MWYILIYYFGEMEVDSFVNFVVPLRDERSPFVI